MQVLANVVSLVLVLSLGNYSICFLYFNYYYSNLDSTVAHDAALYMCHPKSNDTVKLTCLSIFFSKQVVPEPSSTILEYLQWIPASHGYVPPNAVQAGVTAKG